MTRYAFDALIMLAVLLFVLWARMAYYDHRHIEMLCSFAVQAGFCDHGPGPQK